MNRAVTALVCALALVGASGCAGLGGYLADRGRDFTEMFRVEVGAGPGLGVSVRAAGLLDVGASVACTPRVGAIGWRYDRGWAFGAGSDPRAWDAEVDLTLVLDAAAVGVVVAAVATVAAVHELGEDLHEGVSKNVGRVLERAGEHVRDVSEKLPRPGGGRHRRPTVGLLPVIPVPHTHTAGPAPRSQPPTRDEGEVRPDTGEPARRTSKRRKIPSRTHFGFHWIIEGAPGPTLYPSHATHTNWQLLPAVLHWNYVELPDRLPATDRPDGRVWQMTRERGSHWSQPWARRARVHAFDIEASVYAGIVYARVGFSPGELVDFIAGWFGGDPAGDDRFGRGARR